MRTSCRRGNGITLGSLEVLAYAMSTSGTAPGTLIVPVVDARRDALQRELEWIRMSPRARQNKGKARLSAFNELVAESESSERRADRLEIAIPPGPLTSVEHQKLLGQGIIVDGALAGEQAGHGPFRGRRRATSGALPSSEPTSKAKL